MSLQHLNNLNNLNNEALLLMYLAGELPGEHRSRIEQMLAGDAGLRRELEAMREAHADVDAALRSADASQRLPASAAARRFGRQVRSWHARRAAELPVEQPRRGLRIPGWAYPIATAAGVVLAFAGWRVMQPAAPPYAAHDLRENPLRMSPGVNDPLVPPASQDGDRHIYDMDAWPNADVLADPADHASELVLAETEDELYALSNPAADDDDVPTLRLFGEVE